jgi:alpha-glucoside transport system substrate-binding protein
MAEVRRRTVLGATLAALGSAPACSAVARTVGLSNGVRVAVSWSATELAAFRSVLAGWGNADYELIPFGDDIDAALGARTAGRPHVVALPRLGLVEDNVGNLEPLPDGVWHQEYDRIGRQNLPGGPYALPFKLAHKSVVWYRRTVFDRYHLPEPTTWDEWLGLNEKLIRLGIAPLSVGGADGWMLTGFFENILLRNFADTYRALAEPTGDAGLWGGADVRATFEMFGDICGRPGALAGGMTHALVQQFPDAVLEVFRYHRAAMVAAPDFAESVIRHFGVPSDEVGTFTFPARSAVGGPLVMAGDLFVLTRPADPRAVDLIRHLGTPDAPLPWIRDTGGFLAANPDTDETNYSPTLRDLARQLRTHDVVFDLADQLGSVGGRDGLQPVLVNFLRALGDGASRDAAVRAAQRTMTDVAGEAR